MPFRFVMVCEARGDFETASVLVERVLAERFDWLEPLIAECPLWHHPRHARDAVQEGVVELRFVTWKSVRRLADEDGVDAVGQFEGEPGEPDARAARRALRWIESRETGEPWDAVFLIRDIDDEEGREKGLDQGRRSAALRDRVVLGLVRHERESWVLTGFEPSSEAEHESLREQSRTLGFDPRRSGERLIDTRDDKGRFSAKRVLAALTGSNSDREAACWREASLPMLRQRGSGNGLADFLLSVEALAATLRR